MVSATGYYYEFYIKTGTLPNVIFIIDWKIYIYTFVRMAKFLIRDSYHRWLRVNQKNQCYGIYIDVLNSSEATLGQSSCNRFLRDYRTAAPGSPVGRWWWAAAPGCARGRCIWAGTVRACVTIRWAGSHASSGGHPRAQESAI